LRHNPCVEFTNVITCGIIRTDIYTGDEAPLDVGSERLLADGFYGWSMSTP
jgi:hypothetical protein